MSIYIYKNNQQMGPYDQIKVLGMLENGQLSPNDLAIRHGEKEWQKLTNYFPNIAKIEVAKVEAEPIPKKSRKGLLLGCSGFFLVALLITGVLGIFGYRNMFPSDSTENLPDKVKEFKLNDRYPPKGNIWGTEANFVGIYSNESKTKSVIYLMTVFSDESSAKEAMRKELARSCKTGETPMYFSFLKNGIELSQGATCAVPLYVQKDNKLVALGGSGGDAETFITFAENLPFNLGSAMVKK